MRKDNQVILITGGGSGIGLEIAKVFLAHKNTVIITGRNLSKLIKVKTQYSNIHIVQSDVTSDDDVKELAEIIEKDFGGLDVLINNAGILDTFDMGKENHSLERQLQEIEINFSAPIRMVHHFLPQLKKSKEAAIVNVSSGLAYVPFTQAPVYSATKAGVHSWTQAIRLQLKSWNIHVIELLPPIVATPLEANANITGDVGKIMQPETLAQAFWKGFLNNQEEILPGIASQLKFMSRLAPKFIFKQLNKVAVPE